jgi:hypothetical protein
MVLSFAQTSHRETGVKNPRNKRPLPQFGQRHLRPRPMPVQIDLWMSMLLISMQEECINLLASRARPRNLHLALAGDDASLQFPESSLPLSMVTHPRESSNTCRAGVET